MEINKLVGNENAKVNTPSCSPSDSVWGVFASQTVFEDYSLEQRSKLKPLVFYQKVFDISGPLMQSSKLHRGILTLFINYRHPN